LRTEDVRIAPEKEEAKRVINVSRAERKENLAYLFKQAGGQIAWRQNARKRRVRDRRRAALGRWIRIVERQLRRLW
jgi:hypothetical protein